MVKKNIDTNSKKKDKDSDEEQREEVSNELELNSNTELIDTTEKASVPSKKVPKLAPKVISKTKLQRYPFTTIAKANGKYM
jgi:N-acetylglucosamine kinase-like BadF-type ATPase